LLHVPAPTGWANSWHACGAFSVLRVDYTDTEVDGVGGDAKYEGKVYKWGWADTRRRVVVWKSELLEMLR